jgi:hypothetical protein
MTRVCLVTTGQPWTNPRWTHGTETFNWDAEKPRFLEVVETVPSLPHLEASG